MSPPPRMPPSALVPASADEVEQQFYEALQRGDLERLMACWLEEDGISCVHPGGPRIQGFAEVRSAFEAIFAHGSIDIQVQETRRWQADTSAVHSVLERVDVSTDDGPRSAWVMATNVYVLTEHGWRLLCHHASPGTPASTGGAGPSGSALGGPAAGSVLH